MTHLAEVPEAAARGETAALYSDIKAVTGVGMVNLYWRRLATIPAQLAWAWGAVRPLFTSGAIAGEMAALDAAQALPATPPWPAEALAAVGVDGPARATVRRVVADYNRGNAGNLLALSALKAFFDAGAASPARAEARPPAPAPPADLPPITAMDAMPAATAALVRALSAPVSPPGHPLVPSLYRHLAPWPGVLALAAVSVLAPEHGERVRALAAAAFERARGAAPGLAAEMSPPPGATSPAAAVRAQLGATISDYTAGPIATMTVLGRMLALALAEAG